MYNLTESEARELANGRYTIDENNNGTVDVVFLTVNDGTIFLNNLDEDQALYAIETFVDEEVRLMTSEECEELTIDDQGYGDIPTFEETGSHSLYNEELEGMAMGRGITVGSW